MWNLATLVIVGGTWAVGQIRGGGDPRLAFFAAPIVLASLGLAASGLKQPAATVRRRTLESGRPAVACDGTNRWRRWLKCDG